jgi:hypothetical protein
MFYINDLHPIFGVVKKTHVYMGGGEPLHVGAPFLLCWRKTWIFSFFLVILVSSVYCFLQILGSCNQIYEETCSQVEMKEEHCS